ncbi:MAG TPA: TIGR04053 family radical SAM/SPASM domain-containing protein [Methylomirabilota bacterium]|nr:TIGR04053 family radical SAM/SPASM domain-containing protein [Methylomirabilota bacterium]
MKRFNFDERPFIVIWEVTRACGLVCRHCRAEATPNRHPLELDTRESYRLIEQVARCRPTLFVLTGGDPMRRPDLESLIRHAAGCGLRVSLSPSATPEFARADLVRLRAAGVERISLSLDGARRETHDRFRGVPGTWDWTMESIANAARAGVPVQINTTFTRQNLGEFDEFVRRLEDIRPVLWSVFQLVPTGRGRVDDLLTADEMEHLFERLARLSLTAPFDIKTTEGQHYRRVLLQQTRGTGGAGPRAPLGINDGKGFVFISHIGNIQPSGFLPLTAGNVRTHELLDVYRHSPIFRELRDPGLLQGKCGRCEFNGICGGSRARAFAMTGDYLGEELLCVYQPRRQPNRDEQNRSDSRQFLLCAEPAVRRD